MVVNYVLCSLAAPHAVTAPSPGQPPVPLRRLAGDFIWRTAVNNGFGISTFFYFAIPAVLGLAALYWLSFGEGLHYFNRSLSQENRAAEWVGAKIKPRAPMKIEIQNMPDSQVIIDHASFDGGDLWIYYYSEHGARYIQFNWKEIAPDGTIVAASDGYPSVYGEGKSPDDLAAGERAELHLKIDSDPRAVSIKLWMST